MVLILKKWQKGICIVSIYRCVKLELLNLRTEFVIQIMSKFKSCNGEIQKMGPDESGRSLRKQTILRDESRRSFEPKRTIFWLKADDLMKADDPILDVVLTKSRRSWSKRTIFFHWHYESRRSYFWWIFDSKQTILTHAFWYESGRSFFIDTTKVDDPISDEFLTQSGRS